MCMLCALAWSLCNCSVFHHAPLTVSATSGSGSGGDNSGETTSASLMARPGPGPLGSGHVVFSNCDRDGTHECLSLSIFFLLLLSQHIFQYFIIYRIVICMCGYCQNAEAGCYLLKLPAL